MKNASAVINSALAAVVALGSLGLANDVLAQAKQGEKCYGVAKAEKNDCQTATSACAGSAKQDADPTAFIYVPKAPARRSPGAALRHNSNSAMSGSAYPDPRSIPARAGIGLRHPHYEAVLESLPKVGWFEVHS